MVRRDDDCEWLNAAIELSRLCLPSDSAFSVGAILVSADCEVVATGYSRETDPKDHAEEVALAKAGGSGRLAGATLYSSLEPCLARTSRPIACAELVARSGVRRVVIAWREPPVFQPGGGAAWLEGQGIEVIELPQFADAARAVNRQLLDPR